MVATSFSMVRKFTYICRRIINLFFFQKTAMEYFDSIREHYLHAPTEDMDNSKYYLIISSIKMANIALDMPTMN